MGEIQKKYHIGDDGKVYRVNEDGSFTEMGNIEDNVVLDRSTTEAKKAAAQPKNAAAEAKKAAFKKKIADSGMKEPEKVTSGTQPKKSHKGCIITIIIFLLVVAGIVIFNLDNLGFYDNNRHQEQDLLDSIRITNEYVSQAAIEAATEAKTEAAPDTTAMTAMASDIEYTVEDSTKTEIYDYENDGLAYGNWNAVQLLIPYGYFYLNRSHRNILSMFAQDRSEDTQITVDIFPCAEADYDAPYGILVDIIERELAKNNINPSNVTFNFLDDSSLLGKPYYTVVNIYTVMQAT